MPYDYPLNVQNTSLWMFEPRLNHSDVRYTLEQPSGIPYFLRICQALQLHDLNTIVICGE
ncbi:hypothetical protein GCM10010912_41000 [Paenibacillus albidus]|uniref:Uncharacterized protein n=1 Tax=Paenibacillus albidus TaxID=2041023 RepID=A0A917FLY8_9BACL|nr:hypothetical protein GCM10010912_41000 [Paenibacillus albidus]